MDIFLKVPNNKKKCSRDVSTACAQDGFRPASLKVCANDYLKV